MFILVELKKAIRQLADLVQLQLPIQVRQQWFSVGIFPLILQPLTGFGTLSGVKKRRHNIRFRK